MDKLNIGYEMAQFDNKNRDFYNELTEEEKKKFSNFLMIRWGSSVQGSGDLQGFYLISANERLNKNWYGCSRHPQLQWLMATSVSPGLGTQRHNWIGMKKKEPTGIKKQLAELFPHLRDDELEVLTKINTKKDLDEYRKNLGQDVKK
jgi:hypothetical protein